MARKAMIVKDEKRKVLVKKYLNIRKDLRETAVNMKLSQEVRDEARVKLNKLPKNSAAARIRKRCANTGRARGFLNKFGLNRMEFRRLAHIGLIPGVTKASW
jgi:small subunit ribosomal protein S14